MPTDTGLNSLYCQTFRFIGCHKDVKFTSGNTLQQKVCLNKITDPAFKAPNDAEAIYHFSEQ